jgi:mannose-6-phosphate isomerase-like protein (cupin superfamily)
VRIRLDEVPEVSEPENNVVARPLVSGAAHGPDLSVTWIRLTGRHRRLRTDRSTRVYHVLEGSATFRLGDADEVAIGAGDTLVVPRATPYEFAGEMTYLVINGPAFVDGDDLYGA